jgi:non-haem Fe2+, alpha-ketoglutarate-dependent halogenase
LSRQPKNWATHSIRLDTNVHTAAAFALGLVPQYGFPMANHLTSDQVARYQRDGFLFPLRAMAADDARRHRTRLEATRASHPELMQGVEAQKLHLVTTWMADIVRTPTILDAIENLIGPNLLCWSSTLFVKAPDGKSFVSWHQDGNYWGLSNPEIVSAWLALSPSTAESGCMQMIPASHEWDSTEHDETFDANNLLSRGQVMKREIDSSDAVDLVLAPGEISLHHVNVAHASAPNNSSDDRIGIAIRYVSPNVKQRLGERDSATLVRGEDRVGNFEHEQRPAHDFEPAAMDRLARVVARRKSTVYQDAPQ